MDYPSNSHKSKQPQARPPESKNIKQVTSSAAGRRKRSLGKRFSDTFVNGNAKNVWQYVALDILIPAAKDMISDAASAAVDQMLFGGDARNRRRRSPGMSMTGPLGSISIGNKPPTNYGDPRRAQSNQISHRARANHDFDEIVIETRAEGEAVIDGLYELLSTYEQVTVADLYELVGITSNFTDQKWGWRELTGTGISKIRGGYLLNLPRPEVLD